MDLDGVKILSSRQVAIDFEYNWAVFWIAGIIIAAFVISCAFIDKKDIFTYIVLGICIGTFGGWVSGGIGSKPIAYTTEYKVTISEDVSMIKFYEKYIVTNQDELIFTVREKQ